MALVMGISPMASGTLQAADDFGVVYGVQENQNTLTTISTDAYHPPPAAKSTTKPVRTTHFGTIPAAKPAPAPAAPASIQTTTAKTVSIPAPPQTNQTYSPYANPYLQHTANTFQHPSSTPAAIQDVGLGDAFSEFAGKFFHMMGTLASDDPRAGAKAVGELHTAIKDVDKDVQQWGEGMTVERVQNGEYGTILQAFTEMLLIFKKEVKDISQKAKNGQELN